MEDLTMMVEFDRPIDRTRRWLIQQTIDSMSDDERRDLLWRLVADGRAGLRISPLAIAPLGTDATRAPASHPNTGATTVTRFHTGGES